MNNKNKLPGRGIYIAMGANLPAGASSPEQTIHDAFAELSKRGADLVEMSVLWRSPAWPDPSDPPYVNGAARIETALNPRQLLAVLHEVEAVFGRTRDVRWASRPLDLDLLDYRGQIFNERDGLQIPHPRMNDRAFVLLPLRQIAPDWTHPVTGAGIEEMVTGLNRADIDAMSEL